MVFWAPFFHIVSMVIIIEQCEHVLLCHFTMLLYQRQLTMANGTGYYGYWTSVLTTQSHPCIQKYTDVIYYLKLFGPLLFRMFLHCDNSTENSLWNLIANDLILIIMASSFTFYSLFLPNWCSFDSSLADVSVFYIHSFTIK